MASVRPIGDRVLVRVVAHDRMTTGGVILPEQARVQSDRGLVIAVGPGAPSDSQADWRQTADLVATRPIGVKKDEVVLFSPYAGSKVRIGGEDLLLLREHDILGVLEGVEAVMFQGELRIEELDQLPA